MATRRIPLLTTELLRLVASFLPDHRSLIAFAQACKTFQGASEPLLIAPPFLTTTHAARTFAAPFARNVSLWKQAKGKKAMLENKYWTPNELSFSQLDRQPREHGDRAEHWPLPPCIYEGPPCTTCDEPPFSYARPRDEPLQWMPSKQNGWHYHNPSEGYLPILSLITLEAFPHLTKLTFHRCALPDEAFARLFDARGSLRSRLRELKIEECCIFHGAVEWAFVLQTPGTTVKWAPKETQRFFETDEFGEDEDWETDDETERLEDSLRRWRKEEQDEKKELKQLLESSSRRPVWQDGHLRPLSNQRLPQSKKLPFLHLVNSSAEEMGILPSIPAAPTMLSNLEEDNDEDDSGSETHDEFDPLAYPHYRLTPSAKRHEALLHASTDYSSFCLARWSYQVYVPLPYPFVSQVGVPPVVGGQHFKRLTKLTVLLRPMREDEEQPAVELAIFEFPAFPHLKELKLWSWGRVYVTEDEVLRCFRASVSSPPYDAWGASIDSYGTSTLIPPRYLDSSLASLSWEPLDAEDWAEMEQRRGRPYSGLELSLLDLEKVELGLRKRTKKVEEV